MLNLVGSPTLLESDSEVSIYAQVSAIWNLETLICGRLDDKFLIRRQHWFEPDSLARA